MSSQAVSTRGIVVGIAIALLLAMGILEGGVRLLQRYRYGDSASVYRFEMDPVSGLRRMVPSDTKGSQVSIHINALGFRGPELEQPKPAARIRLAFVGSSTTFCAEVSGDEMTWPHLVWKNLQADFPGASLDYVNAGVPGYTSGQSLQNLRYNVAALKPDIIIIYEATNDLSYDTRLLAEAQGIYRHENHDAARFGKWSVAWQLLEKNLQIFTNQKVSAGGNNEVLRFDPRSISGRFEKRLTDLVATSKRTAPVVALATFAYKLRREQSKEQQLRSANTALFYMPYLDIEGLLAGYEEYNRVIRAVATNLDVLLIDGESAIPGDNQHFYDSVHFTDEGSRAMARRVARSLMAHQRFRDFIASRARPS